jgi:hypothetical protein
VQLPEINDHEKVRVEVMRKLSSGKGGGYMV